MQVVKDLIKTTVLAVQPNATFISGRSFDSAIETIIKDTSVVYVYLDPVTMTASQIDSVETYSITLGFIKQDSMDSSPEEMDAIIEEMYDIARSFLDELEATNTVQFNSASFSPSYRIKNVCTGVVITFDLTTMTPC